MSHPSHQLSKDDSHALRVANTLATVMILVIHYNSRTLIDWSSPWNASDIFQELLVNGVSRVAVPLFALLSGFFLFGRLSSLSSYGTVLAGRARSLLLPYLLVAVFAFVANSFLKESGATDFQGQWTWHDFVYYTTVHPAPVQLWFLRDLMLLVVLSPALMKLPRGLSLALGLLLGGLWLFNAQPLPIVGGYYLLHTETLFFFWLGGTLARNSLSLTRILPDRPWALAAVAGLWLLLVVVRMAIDPRINVWYVEDYSTISLLLYKVAILVGLVVTLGASHHLRNQRWLVAASGLTFFVFLFHMDPFHFFQAVTRQWVESRYAFYLDFPIAVGVLFTLAWSLSRWAPPVYSWITGGRAPSKS